MIRPALPIRSASNAIFVRSLSSTPQVCATFDTPSPAHILPPRRDWRRNDSPTPTPGRSPNSTRPKQRTPPPLNEASLLVSRLPSTATPDDLRRLAATVERGRGHATGLGGLPQVEYHASVAPRSIPPSATLTFPNTAAATAFHRAIRSGAQLAGARLNSVESSAARSPSLLLARAISPAPGRTVLLTGVPGHLKPSTLRSYLRGFHLDDRAGADGTGAVEAHPAPEMQSTSRWLVRLTSVSEAHRLVRKFHHTWFAAAEHKEKYRIRARVVY